MTVDSVWLWRDDLVYLNAGTTGRGLLLPVVLDLIPVVA